jgi:hypothetical protein
MRCGQRETDSIGAFARALIWQDGGAHRGAVRYPRPRVVVDSGPTMGGRMILLACTRSVEHRDAKRFVSRRKDIVITLGASSAAEPPPRAS